MGFKVKSKGGNYPKATRYLANVSKKLKQTKLEKYGEEGVLALSILTPIDTGKTAGSWYYKIIEENDRIKLEFKNSNIVNDWANVAILLQYGHATKNGGYVEGIDYINPALRPIFDKIAENAWEEIKRV